MIIHSYLGHAATISDVPLGHPFWYVNANGLVEIAVTSASVAEQLDIKVGMQIDIRRNG